MSFRLRDGLAFVGGAAGEGVCSERVSKRFGHKEVLSSVSFRAPAGRVTLLAGRNGVGKTTWIRIATGLARGDDGSVSFDGMPLCGVRDDLAVVSDEPPVYGQFSGRTNLHLLSGRRKLSSSRLAEVCEMLTLDEALLRQPARGYSLGQRRRLAAAAALLREPQFLFLDEPTIGLDPIAWSAVRGALRESAERGATVLLTGQDFGEFESLADNVVVLADGQVSFEGRTQELLKKRPPRVRMVLAHPEEVRGYIDRPCVRIDQSTLEFLCEDEGDARALLASVRELPLDFTSIGVVQDSLQEAFLELHKVGKERGV